MGDTHGEAAGPDLGAGIPLSQIADGGMIGGHVGPEAVLVARHGDDVFAVGGTCTHYGAPLGDGILVGETVRCPWHHACFSLRTGRALRAPALRALARWSVERRDGRIFVRERAPEAGQSPPTTRASHPASVVIVGAGAAGDAAADTLRLEGYTGPVTLIGADTDAPYDRPNLSKDYLAGNAPEDWIPLRAPDFYRERGVRVLLGRRVERLDTKARAVTLDDGTSMPYGAVLLATGASPIPFLLDGDASRVRYLRTLADSRAIVAEAGKAKHAVVVGASFIGLEVAASLRARGLVVHVVAPEQRPLERILGPELGDFVRGLHEAQGVVFRLGHTVRWLDAGAVTLDDGERITCDLVVAGIGVRPNDDLARSAALRVERGIVVDARLESSAPGVFAAGDVARYPDARSGAHIRVEHWVVAQRQGQTAARNILGAGETFDAVPFFWSRHYDVAINYVGHAEKWDHVEIDGSLARHDCSVFYRATGGTLAVATVGRDRACLAAELAMERDAEPFPPTSRG